MSMELSPEAEEELIAFAQEQFPDAFELAVNTGDEDLFYKVISKAHAILIEKSLTSLVLKGLIEVSGIEEDGEFRYGLTENGKVVAEHLVALVKDDMDNGN